MFDRSSQWKLFVYFPFMKRDELFSYFVCVDISDFGYTLDGDVCVPTSLATPIPAVCPEGKTYQHTRG